MMNLSQYDVKSHSDVKSQVHMMTNYLNTIEFTPVKSVPLRVDSILIVELRSHIVGCWKAKYGSSKTVASDKKSHVKGQISN